MRMNVDIEALSKRSLIFAALSDEEMGNLLALTRETHHPARHIVFQEGEPGDHLLILVSGRVKVSLLSADGKEAILSILEPGDLLGEMALLDGEARSATVTTMEDSSFLMLRRQDLIPFLERYPQVALKLLASLSKRLRAANEIVEGLSFRSLASRLSRILINLGQQYGRATAEGVVVGLKLSQEELGNLVGVSRESVNRQLRQWSDEGLLTFNHGTVVLKNTEALFRASLDLDQ